MMRTEGTRQLAFRKTVAVTLRVWLLAGGLLLSIQSQASYANPALPSSAAVAKQATSPDSAQLSAFRKAIRTQYDLKEKAFAAHDAETILTKFYTPDVISVGEGEGIYVGTDQIRPLYEEVVQNNKVKVESIYTFVDGSAGWDWADFHVYPRDGKAKPFTFAILFLWAKVNGQWLCKGDFFVNGSLKDGKLWSPPAAGAK
jgi:ketosteroid isomerase-like protein